MCVRERTGNSCALPRPPFFVYVVRGCEEGTTRVLRALTEEREIKGIGGGQAKDAGNARRTVKQHCFGDGMLFEGGFQYFGLNFISQPFRV